jgi:subtilisin family serine protease
VEELSVTIGGKKFLLKEAKQQFSVLTSNPKAINELRNKRSVQNIVPAAPGIQVVTSTSSKTRDSLMKQVRKSGISHHVYETVDRVLPQQFIITDKISIKFKSQVTKEKREEILRNYHLQFRMELAPNLYSCQLTNETGMNPIKLCNNLNANDNIEYSEPDFVIENKLFDIITNTVQDNLFRDAWHLNDEVNIPFVRKGSDIKIKGAWKITKGNPDIIIAVMDDGFDLTNPDLKGKEKFPSDFTRTEPVSGDPATLRPDDDIPLAEKTEGRRDYHGTPCAGLALASEGHGQVIGVAPNCSFMPVRWNVGKTQLQRTLEIFHYISKRADIVSCSWGRLPIPDGKLANTIHETINELAKNGGRRGKGLVFCFAAGNDNLPTYMSAQENTRGLEYYKDIPGFLSKGINFKGFEINGGWTEIDNIIVVSSYTSMNKKSLYSNWGPHITIAAPSDNWHPIGPSTRKKYHSINLVTTDNENHGIGLFDKNLSDSEEGYITHGMGGTSGATPIVAGVCGIMLSANPNLTAKRIKEILQETANKTDIDYSLDEILHNNNDKDGEFRGENGHSLFFGFGKVNAEAAVMQAKNENI